MLARLSLAIAPVILLGFGSAALAQQAQHDLSAGSGDHMRSYGPVQTENAAPQTASPQQPRGRASRLNTRTTARANAVEVPTQSREVSARPNEAQPAPQYDLSAGSGDHMRSYGPVR
jgi:hypothetical protein